MEYSAPQLTLCFNAPKGWYHLLTATSGDHYNIFIINPLNPGLICHSEQNEFSKKMSHDWGSLNATARSAAKELVPLSYYPKMLPLFQFGALCFNAPKGWYHFLRQIHKTHPTDVWFLRFNAPKGWYHFLTLILLEALQLSKNLFQCPEGLVPLSYHGIWGSQKLYF